MQHDFILLDRSSSMGLNNKWGEALAASNAYVKKLADDNVDTGVTLAVFDKHQGDFDFTIIRDRITPSTWKPVSNDDAAPRGWTPLNQATHKIVELANAGGYDKVAIIIVTDGEENASAPGFSVQTAKALLDECRAKGWQVIFLGADFQNAAQASSYGNAARSTISASARNFVGTMTMAAGKRAEYGATGQAISFTDDEKAKAAQK